MAATKIALPATSLPSPTTTTPTFEPVNGRALPSRPLPTTTPASPASTARPASPAHPAEDDVLVLYEDVQIKILNEVVNLVDDPPIVYELIHLE